jgi:hypothetical protein
MSNPYASIPPENPESPYYQGPSENGSNSLGVVGFVVSLVGLFLCGIPSIIGLGISAVALGKRPKGFAVAGVLLGILGLIELIAVVFFAIAAFRSVSEMSTFIQEVAIESQAKMHASSIGQDWKDSGELPAEEEGNEQLHGATDMLENSFVYETDGTSFSIRSAGIDRELNTEDDIVAGPYDDAEAAIEEGLQDLEGFEFDEETGEFKFDSKTEAEVEDE